MCQLSWDTKTKRNMHISCFWLNQSIKKKIELNENSSTPPPPQKTTPTTTVDLHRDDQKVNGGDQEQVVESAVWDCGSPLYDSYELVSLTHLIERHFMVFPMFLGGSKRFVASQFPRPVTSRHVSKQKLVCFSLEKILRKV